MQPEIWSRFWMPPPKVPSLRELNNEEGCFSSYQFEKQPSSFLQITDLSWLLPGNHFGRRAQWP
ncbi:hypothetical protein [Flavonifractor plautii]|uniref:hypothetical protein n=1 Tax=Flavonifractor plautii TaxID=292800 RepID=UPI001958F314|nr:hypothetical protein [Flavonifractor plautii]MBM6663823.1 hypothetical protein [Flavonifractor plautii]